MENVKPFRQSSQCDPSTLPAIPASRRQTQAELEVKVFHGKTDPLSKHKTGQGQDGSTHKTDMLSSGFGAHKKTHVVIHL